MSPELDFEELGGVAGLNSGKGVPSLPRAGGG